MADSMGVSLRLDDATEGKERKKPSEQKEQN